MARSPLVLAIAAASTEAPERARSLAARWGAIDAADDPDTVLAPNLLLGLARLLARDDAVLEGIHENDDLVLTLIDGEGSERVSEVFSVNENFSEQLFRFLWERVHRAWFFENEEEDDEEADALESISFAAARRISGRPVKLGTIRLDWSKGERRVRKDLGEVLRWRQVAWNGEGRAPSGEPLIRLLLDRGRVRPIGGFDELDASWASYAGQLGREPHSRADAAEVFELIAPAPLAARTWVDFGRI